MSYIFTPYGSYPFKTLLENGQKECGCRVGVEVNWHLLANLVPCTRLIVALGPTCDPRVSVAFGAKIVSHAYYDYISGKREGE